MKKVLSLIMVAAMILTASMLVFADTEFGAKTEGNTELTFQKATVAQTLDGIISEGEYYKVEVNPDILSYADAGAGVDAAKALKWDCYTAWDDAGVRTAVVYTFATTGDFGIWDCKREGDEGNMWNATAVQLSIGNQPKVMDSGDYFELGYALTSDTKKEITVVWHADEDGNADFVPTAGKDFTVKNIGSTLVYEIFTPWTAIAPAAITEGKAFAWNVVVAGGSDNYGHCHAQISSGCTGNGKQNGYFANVTLAAAPAPATTEAPAPAADPAPAPAADPAPAPAASTPKTADATVIMTLIAAASAFGGAVVFKKRK